LDGSTWSAEGVKESAFRQILLAGNLERSATLGLGYRFAVMTDALGLPNTRSALPLTGERTVPGIDAENYWFRRHEVAYQWVARQYQSALKGTQIVDAGPGEGYGVSYLADSLQAEVIGLELDWLAAQHAHHSYGNNPGVAILSANLDAFPLQSNSVDAVISMQVIEHLWDLPGFLAETRRVLKPSGQCVLATPNRVTFSPGLGRGQKPTNPFHVEEFDAEQLRGLLLGADFVDVAVWEVRHAGMIAQWEQHNGSIVAAQVNAVLSGQAWPEELTQVVTKVDIGDFEIEPYSPGIDLALDLIVTGRRA